MPGSKSESNRALLLAALADGPSTLHGVLRARDTELMMAALRAFGVHTDGDDPLTVTPPTQFWAPRGPIDVGLAGTVARFLPTIAILAPGSTEFIGDAAMANRPLAPLLDALRQLGAQVVGNTIPFTVTAPVHWSGPTVQIDASASSQFISGLLLTAARFPSGIDLVHTGAEPPSQPHIAMTIHMLRDRGVHIDADKPAHWRVWPGPVAGMDQHVEPDLSNAAAFAAAAALVGGQVTIAGWPPNTFQPGAAIRDLLARMGADTQLGADGLQVNGTGQLQAIDVDLHEASELTPVAAALLAYADGTSTISGIAHIRGHETNRLAALTNELTKVGVQAEETRNGLRIVGRPAGVQPPSEPLCAYADHRMAQFAALVGLRTPGLRLDDIACTSKTMPDFADRWLAMLGNEPRKPLS